MCDNILGSSPAPERIESSSPSLEKVTSLLPAFSTKLGAVYNTDCMNLLGALKDKCIDTVFADPPFNLGKDYGNGKDKDELDNGEYLGWCYRWIDECVRVLKPGGAMFIYNLPQWAFHVATHLEQQQMTLPPLDRSVDEGYVSER
jgi:site-specific DNA-methyltransferase (adenine-specific)